MFTRKLNAAVVTFICGIIFLVGPMTLQWIVGTLYILTGYAAVFYPEMFLLMDGRVRHFDFFCDVLLILSLVAFNAPVAAAIVAASMIPVWVQWANYDRIPAGEPGEGVHGTVW